MITTAFVNIWGETAGAVSWDEERGTAAFEYDPVFVRNGWEPAPLVMPLRGEGRIFSFPELRKSRPDALHAFNGLPGLLADSLPDQFGNRLMNAWLAENGRPENSMNPVEQLCFIGSRGMGALEFEPAQFASGKRSFRIEIDSLINISRELLRERAGFSANLKKDEKQAMRDILRIGTSAGGARPKAIITCNKKTGEIRSGQASAPAGFGHWLIKLDGVSDAQFGQSHGYGRVEMAYYLMALDCGIEMMESHLLEEGDRAHFMTRRFDREGADTRHHVQTFCALRHFDFNDVFSYSYEQLFQTMRLLRLPYPQAEEMYRRMVFNVLARNCDDHTKNVAFRLRQHHDWELAPAYDMCHAYRPGSPWVSRHALSINGKRDQITRKDLLAFAKSVTIKKAGQIIEQIDTVVSDWPRYAEKTGVPEPLRKAIGETLVQN